MLRTQRHEFDTTASRPRWWARSAQVDFFIGVAFSIEDRSFLCLGILFRSAEVREEGGLQRQRVYEKNHLC